MVRAYRAAQHGVYPNYQVKMRTSQVHNPPVHDLVPAPILFGIFWVQRLIAFAFVVLGTLQLYASGLLNFAEDSRLLDPSHLFGLLFLTGGVALFVMNEANHRVKQ